MLGRKKKAVPVIAPLPAPEEGEGDFRITLKPDGDSWLYKVSDRAGKSILSGYLYNSLTDEGRDAALAAVRRTIDRHVEVERLRAEAEDYEEWYGTSYKGARQIIDSQAAYIDQLERKCEVGPYAPAEMSLA